MNGSRRIPLLRKAGWEVGWTQRVSLCATNNFHTSSQQKQEKEQLHCFKQPGGRAVLVSIFSFLRDTNRHRGDSNPCGQRPMDFESISLATRTQCLVMYLRITEIHARSVRSSPVISVFGEQAQMTRKFSSAADNYIGITPARHAGGPGPNPRTLLIRLSGSIVNSVADLRSSTPDRAHLFDLHASAPPRF